MAMHGTLCAVEPYKRGVAVEPSDEDNLAKPCDALYIGGATEGSSDVSLVGMDGGAVLFKDAAVGSILPVCAQRVNDTNTTATNIVALYYR